MKKFAFGLLAAGIILSGAAVPATFASTADTSIIQPEVDPANPYAAMYWTYPTTSNHILSPYGYRSDGFHKGFDINVTNQPVYTAQAGTILSAGSDSSMGTYVVVKTTNTAPDNTANKLITRSLHLSSKSVSTGGTVTKGQQIGVSGNTGQSSAPHLHFDVNDGNTWNGPDLNESNTIDPEIFWPSRSFTYATSIVPAETISEEHAMEDADPENFFEDTLINYVGKDKFDKWMKETAKADRKLSKFKKKFNISDELAQKLHDDAFKN